MRVHAVWLSWEFYYIATIVYPEAHSAVVQWLGLAIFPGLGMVLSFLFVVPRMAMAILRNQRTNVVAFIGEALRGTLATLVVQIIIVARCVLSPFSWSSYSAILA